ncbi:SatD family protein [Methanobacterium sp.]|uniref:SatD family protein n=1 Tax=Methanobacterium sp. TaxID=2164 RepID=UPI0025F81170|nr:SatD family protein [Methanobacterium sp.]MBI5458122.1 hypothetical protein [Methanobacterium sp.]
MNREGHVLLGDIVSSKKIKNRAKFQKKLMKACDAINQAHNDNIIAEMKIIKGSDEIGCLLGNLAPLYDIIDGISNDLYPVKIRFVLVNGKIDTGFETKDISQMDGPAFHQASKLIMDLKKEKLIFNMSTSNKILDILITNNINLIYLLKKRWSSAKLEIIHSYERWGDQRKVASKLGISQQTVSYHLMSSNWKEIKKMEAELNQSLKELRMGST